MGVLLSVLNGFFNLFTDRQNVYLPPSGNKMSQSESEGAATAAVDDVSGGNQQHQHQACSRATETIVLEEHVLVPPDRLPVLHQEMVLFSQAERPSSHRACRSFNEHKLTSYQSKIDSIANSDSVFVSSFFKL
jgi:hypothetical protein